MMLRIRTSRDREAVASYINKLPEGKHYDVAITLKRDKRSLSQNRYYWACITCISDETGSPKEQIHDTFRDMFLPKVEVPDITGEVIQKAISTTNLNTKQFAEYMNQIFVFAAQELGIVLPTPEDDTWNLFVEHFDR